MKIPSKYSQREIILALSMVKGIGDKTLRYIWRDGNLRFDLLSSAKLQSLKTFDWENFDRILDSFAENNANYIDFTDDDYPVNLINIPDFPPVIYYKGNSGLFKMSGIAVVGTRKISDYGRKSAMTLVRKLAEKGLVIISGMAFGVDVLAHKLTLEAKGYTIAVLGSGVDVPSPYSNMKIYDEILKNDGLIVSEHPLGTAPVPGFFPRRNRIISGLSKATLVIEAGEKSGALITARQAFEQNREVFAVPGDISLARSKGTNLIIKEGVAKLVTEPEDILGDLGYVLQESGKFENTNFTFDTEIERKIFQLLSDKYLQIDEIARILETEVGNISKTLTMMELKGMVTTIDSKYCLCI